MSATIERPWLHPAPVNEAVEPALASGERGAMICDAAGKNNPSARGTPGQVTRMLVDELMRGRFGEPPSLANFDNRFGYDGLIATGSIEVRSTCAHHLIPIRGEAFAGKACHRHPARSFVCPTTIASLGRLAPAMQWESRTS